MASNPFRARSRMSKLEDAEEAALKGISVAELHKRRAAAKKKAAAKAKPKAPARKLPVVKNKKRR